MTTWKARLAKAIGRSDDLPQALSKFVAALELDKITDDSVNDDADPLFDEDMKYAVRCARKALTILGTE